MDNHSIERIPHLILNSQLDALHINKLSDLFCFKLPSTIKKFNDMIYKKLELKEILTKQRITKFFNLNPCNIPLFNIEKINELDFQKVNIIMSKFIEKVINNQSTFIDINTFKFDIKIESNNVNNFKNKLLKLKDNIININELKNYIEMNLNEFNKRYICNISNCDGEKEFRNIENDIRNNINYLNIDLQTLWNSLNNLFDKNDEIKPKLSFHISISSLIIKINNQLDYEISNVLNFHPKIKKSDENFKIIKSLLKNIQNLKPILIGANNQGAFFTTLSIQKLINEKKRILEIQRVFEWYEMGKIYKLLQPYLKDFENIGEIVNLLDMHQAYARSNFKNSIFIENKGNLCINCKELQLDLNTENIENIQFIGFEHPLIPDCVKNDFFFHNQFIKLSGPNTSGKSTILRSISLIIYLTQIGAPSLIEQSFIKYFECIRIRIGSADKEGESTFMVEMKELSEIISIIETVKGNLLILIDELGRGTSINDGLAISKGVMEYLKRQSNVYCIFVTHFHELDYKYQNEGIEEETLSLKNYKLIKGSNLSFGIECAKDCGFPESVIENAYKYYNDES